MKTICHFRGMTKTIELNDFWGGANIVDYAGHLWRVSDAVNRLTHTDVYAYRISDDDANLLHSAWGAWGLKKSEVKESEVND